MSEVEMLTTLEAAAPAGYDPPQAGVIQIRRWAREGRLEGARETTSGWKIPVTSVPTIAAARGNRGNKTGRPRRRSP